MNIDRKKIEASYTVDDIREWLAWWQEKACGFVSVRTDIADADNGIAAWMKRKGENAEAQLRSDSDVS
jgi:hypothetical protein